MNERSDDVRNIAADQLRALRAEASALVKSMPGPLRRIAVRTADHAVEVEWPDTEAAPVPAGGVPPVPMSPAVATCPPGAPASAAGESQLVRAPLVGTFYLAPQPGAEPFVVVGDRVEPGQTLAIVEAMKLMNHISAEEPGRVVEILVANGDPVEFEQPLMRIAVDEVPA